MTVAMNVQSGFNEKDRRALIMANDRSFSA